MTEESFQQAKIIVQKANAWRSRIIYYDKELLKWQEKVAHHTINGNGLRREAAKVNVKLYQEQLSKSKEEFAALQLPN